ncbi:MAG TPA: biopolymer transporter ExbD [Longimicrobiaceae bacterium]|nr:biopolymer transporter ExbD [Longimicrobiaceae bacterium]
MGTDPSRTIPEANAEMNATPMIDVMLVLLIVFMVLTPALTGLVALPSAATALPEREDRVTLVLDARGGLLLDAFGTPLPVSPADLPTRLLAAYASRPSDHVLYLKADTHVSYDRVLDVVDAARLAGVSRIGAITLLDRTPRPR